MEARVAREVMEFRPARPRRPSLWSIVILAIVFIVLALANLAHRAFEPLAALAGVGLLLAAGIWFQFRLRFPGDPTLRVDAEGMSYIRGGREQGLKWTEVSEIMSDSTLGRMLFLPVSGRPPIIMHPDMVAADGRAWALMIEHYWRPQDG